MSGEFTRPATYQENRPATASWSSLNGNASSEESPELLRWRADTLLDEMMLGAVDVSANHGISGVDRSTFADAHSPTLQQPSAPPATLPQPTSDHFGPNPPQSHHDSYNGQWPNDGASLPARAGTVDGFQHQGEFESRSNPRYSTPREDLSAQYQQQQGGRTPHSSRQTFEQEHAADSVDGYSDALLHRPSAVESVERYDSAARNASPGEQRSYTEQPWQPASYTMPTYHTGYNTRADERPTWSVVSGASNDYLNSIPRNTDAPHTAGDRRSSQISSGAPIAYPTHIHGDSVPALGPVTGTRRNMPFADSMTVGPHARRVSPLLPRQSQFDLQSLQQEMATLEEDIHARMPPNQGSTERALRLLEKGRTILHTDPDRSAEVSYYVQQVKAILERSSQRYQWSGLYRNRLTTYLLAWLAFSLIVLVACALYESDLNALLGRTLGLAHDGLFMQHWLVLGSTLFAGTLGGALGALYNMWRHGRKQHGFFDRKYGMLGLVLPLIGAVFGIVLYLVFGAGYFLFDINPATHWLASLLPALLALLFGLYQEHLYGTAD